MCEELIDVMSDEQVRDFARRVVESLNLAEDDGVFGKESWLGFLQIEVEV